MSTFNRNTLALALAAALLPASAFAYSVGTGPTASPGDQTPEKIATADIVDATTAVTLSDDAFIRIASTDNIIGRTTGFGIRLTLSNGAEFTLAGVGINDVTLNAAMLAGGWTATVAAGDGTGSIVLSVSPNGSGVGVPDGDLLVLPNIVLDHLTALQASGQQVTLNVAFFDPVTTLPILTNQSTPLLESGNPLAIGCDTTTGDLAKRIDVGVTVAQASKTFFSSTGAIGLADSGTFDAGSITAAVAPGFTFSYLGTDAFVTEVTGTFSAFKGAETAPGSGIFATTAFLSTDNCATAITETASTNAAADKITFAYTGTDVGIAPGGFTASLCFQVPGGNTNQIDASAVNVTTKFTRGTFNATANTCSDLPLQFNGSVVKVFTVNPAGNTTAVSFIRVSNWGNTGGKVTVQGWDDNGTAAPGGNVTFNLAAGKSQQINSTDLENGNAGKGLTGALGDGAGKWRLVVTGEFDGMVVSSLNRNEANGTVTNLTDADNRGEQLNDGK